MKVLASTLAAVLSPVLAVATVTAPASARAAQVQEAKCQVHAVLASKGEGGIPEELAFLTSQLEDDEFAAYKSFKLVEKQALKIKRGKASEVRFKTGNRLGLTLLDNDDSRLKLHADLSSRDGKNALVGMDYSIKDGGVLMVRAGEYTLGEVTGKLFFAIQCARSG